MRHLAFEHAAPFKTKAAIALARSFACNHQHKAQAIGIGGLDKTAQSGMGVGQSEAVEIEAGFRLTAPALELFERPSCPSAPGLERAFVKAALSSGV